MVLVVKDIVIFRKNETILILISFKRYFSHLENSSADPEGGTGGPDPHLEYYKLYGFL